jgi:hypothetical protein
MTVAQIKQYLEIVLNKHSSGNTLSPQEFNTLMSANIYGFVKTQVMAYRQYVNGASPVDDPIFTALLYESLQKSQSVTLTAGAFTMPTDLLMVNDLYGTYNSLKEIELVSPEEYAKRTHNLLDKPIAYYPVAYIVGTSCKVFPTTMSGVVLVYIAKPTIPVYDYYVDANYNVVSLAASATRALAAGEYGSAGQVAGQTVTSLTVELTIPEESHMLFADYLLAKVSMRDRDSNLYQAVQNEKTTD